MLGALILSFVGALICAILTVVGGIILTKKKYKGTELEGEYSLGWAIFSFIVNFVELTIVFYVCCAEQTWLTVVAWIWPSLLIQVVISVLSIEFANHEEQFASTCILMLISGIICFSTLFGPVQNMICNYDAENIDITYAIKSDEILAKIELGIDNSYNAREKYSVESPEMRRVNGEFLAVYHIINSENQSTPTVEYIPGYGIQKKGELPKIISKRIYFDTSYTGKKDALRTVRRKYPTVVIGESKFDIDDEWNPYQVFEYRENKMSSTGEDYGLIILDLINGTSEKYPVAEGKVPSWVDYTTTYPR